MYNRKLVKEEAKQAIKGKMGILIGVILLYAFIVAAATYIPCASLIIAGPFGVGMAIFMLEIVRGWQFEFSDMFKGFKNFETNCVAGILTTIYTVLWTFLFIIPGMIKAYSYSMTFYILADHPEMKAREAITASRVMMDGHKFDYFVLELSFFWWHLLAIITCGIAYIYILPYMMAAQAKFYESIKDEKNIFAQPEVAEATVTEETIESVVEEDSEVE